MSDDAPRRQGFHEPGLGDLPGLLEEVRDTLLTKTVDEVGVAARHERFEPERITHDYDRVAGRWRLRGQLDEGHGTLHAEHLYDGEIGLVRSYPQAHVVGLGSVREESDEAAPLGDETGLEEPAGCRIELPGQSYVPIRKRESIL